MSKHITCVTKRVDLGRPVTAEELIEYLSQFPPDTYVLIRDADTGQDIALNVLAWASNSANAEEYLREFNGAPLSESGLTDEMPRVILGGHYAW